MSRDLLILDNSIDPVFYRPVDHWERAAGFRPEAIRLPGGGVLPDPGLHRHILVTGSEDTVTALPPWAEIEARWLKEAVRHGARVLGSCWGHQLIAIALGNAGCVRHCATPEFGWQSIVADVGFDLLPPGEFFAFCSHFDEVILGCHPEMQVLGRSASCAVHLLRWGKLPVWGVQAHPEIDPDTAMRFLEQASQIWPGQAARFEAALAGPVRDSNIVAALVSRFLER